MVLKRLLNIRQFESSDDDAQLLMVREEVACNVASAVFGPTRMVPRREPDGNEFRKMHNSRILGTMLK
jgi:hypothetical protein